MLAEMEIGAGGVQDKAYIFYCVNQQRKYSKNDEKTSKRADRLKVLPIGKLKTI